MQHKMEENQTDVQGSDFTPVTSPSLDSGFSTYHDYPTSKPFINSDYTRVDAQVNTFPTSERDAVISALKNLQENIKKLEIERNIAETNLQSLATETEQYKELFKFGKLSTGHWKHREEHTAGGDADVTSQIKELASQLSSAEQRCQLLEKQLDQMRKMVEKSEQSRRELMEQSRKMQQEKRVTGADNRLHMERLERDQRRLTLAQTLAESKIRELEQKIKEEKKHRETLQARTAQLESDAHSKNIPLSQEVFTSPPTQIWKTKKPSKKKKKIVTSKHAASTCRTEPMKHYRLNLAGIPFVAGQSTGPSHSLGANVQNVLAMLKLHNTALCSQVNANGESQRSESSISSGTGKTEADQDLDELLNHLQDEFGHLSSQHQELMEQLHVASNSHVRKQLQQELHVLFQDMENKTQQISRIRQHQRKIKDAKKGDTSTRGTKSKQTHTGTNSYHHHNLCNKNINSGYTRSRPDSKKSKDSTSPGRPELYLLKDVRKVQRTLRKEDLFWE